MSCLKWNEPIKVSDQRTGGESGRSSARWMPWTWTGTGNHKRWRSAAATSVQGYLNNQCIMKSSSKDLHSGIPIKTLIHIVAFCTLFVTAGCGGGGGGGGGGPSPVEPQPQPQPQLPTMPQDSQTMQPIVSGAPVCPVDVSAVSQDGLAVTVNFDTPSIDSMGRQVTAVCSPQPGSLFEVGTHEVMCERPNDPGARCTFPLTVLANTDPVGGGICDRTVQVRDAIVDRIPGIHTCSAVTVMPTLRW